MSLAVYSEADEGGQPLLLGPIGPIVPDNASEPGDYEEEPR